MHVYKCGLYILKQNSITDTISRSSAKGDESVGMSSSAFFQHESLRFELIWIREVIRVAMKSVSQDGHCGSGRKRVFSHTDFFTECSLDHGQAGKEADGFLETAFHELKVICIF